MRRAIAPIEELPAPGDDGAQERGAVLWRFRDGFAEAEGVGGPVVDGEQEVVRGYCCRDGGAARGDGRDCRGRGAVF